MLRAHVFGDASGTRMRFAVRDGSGDREVSRWITCDWVGWRALTWDLELDTLEQEQATVCWTVPSGSMASNWHMHRGAFRMSQRSMSTRCS